MYFLVVVGILLGIKVMWFVEGSSELIFGGVVSVKILCFLGLEIRFGFMGLWIIVFFLDWWLFFFEDKEV